MLFYNLKAFLKILIILNSRHFLQYKLTIIKNFSGSSKTPNRIHKRKNLTVVDILQYISNVDDSDDNDNDDILDKDFYPKNYIEGNKSQTIY